MTSSKRNRSKVRRYSREVIGKKGKKLEYRAELARLPFPKKVEIITRLQDIDNSLAKAAGRTPKRGWEIQHKKKK